MPEPSDQLSPPRPPLGLPSGSVRALLTLMIVTVVLVEVVRGRPVDLLWTETLMIVLAHYFTSRRFLHLPPEAVERLEAEGYLESESHPLYLPRHSIRALVVLAFVALAVYLYQQGRLWQYESSTILVTVFAYLVGVLGRGLLEWWTGSHPARRWQWWTDTKAAAALLVLAITAAAYLLGVADQLPDRVHLAALGLVLFYFGSR